MKLTDLLTQYVHAAFTGLWIQSFEPDEAEREIVRHAKQREWKVAVWDIANGLRLDEKTGWSQSDSGGDPLAALRALPALAEHRGTALLILHNFHKFLNWPFAEFGNRNMLKNSHLGRVVRLTYHCQWPRIRIAAALADEIGLFFDDAAMVRPRKSAKVQ